MSVPLTISTDGSGNVVTSFGSVVMGGSVVADWINGALCSTFPPGGGGWPPGPASDGPATNPAVILDFLNAIVWDGTGGPSIDIANRQLLDPDGDLVVDFSSLANARTNQVFPSVCFADYTDVTNSGTSASTIWSYTFAGTFGESPTWAQQGATISFALALSLTSTAATKRVQITVGGATFYDTGALSVGTDTDLVIRGNVITTPAISIPNNIGWRALTTAGSSGITLGAGNLAQYSAIQAEIGSFLGMNFEVIVTAGSGGVDGDITGRMTRVTLAPPAAVY